MGVRRLAETRKQEQQQMKHTFVRQGDLTEVTLPEDKRRIRGLRN